MLACRIRTIVDKLRAVQAKFAPKQPNIIVADPPQVRRTHRQQMEYS